jgi:hypothetical protein
MDEKRQTLTQMPTATNGTGSAKTDLELLRWRAEVLMDEMMLGGVDFAANGPTSVSASSAARRVALESEGLARESARNAVDAAYIAHHRDGPDKRQDSAYAGPISAAMMKSTYVDTSQRDARREQSRASSALTPASGPSPQVSHELESYESQPWVASAEERYRQLVRPQPASVEQSTVVKGDGAGASLGVPTIWQDGDTPHPPGANGHGAFNHDNDLPTVTATATAVRRSAPQFGGSMSNLGGNGRRSNLLPRLSTADVEALQHEIFALQNEIDHILPIGHDSNKRVRHLLERAQAILQQDAMRSAEVEYYLQQVRTIFQRVQQTVDWSSIYRNRLFVYLTAWLLLSGIVLVACYLYQDLIENFVALISTLAMDGLILQHLLTAIATFFAGTLGGALGTLANLQHHNRLPHGFIDRKFGLRGLILPFMGGIIGLLCYTPIGLLFSLLGLNPSRNILLSVFPVLLAFIYGVSQESIYGTRE